MNLPAGRDHPKELSATPSKSTGGGGFNHEDEVAAYFLARMLAGSPPFGSARGVIVRVDFQARPHGWLLDDLVLTLRADDGDRRCATSVKSNRQFATDHGAPPTFVREAWEQFLNGGPMDPGRDLLALAASGVPADVLDDFNTLRDLAEASDTASLADALRVKGFADEGKRRMAESFACPAGLAAAHGGVAPPAAALIARVLVLDFDFPSAASRSRAEAIQLCRQGLRDPSFQAAARLWDDLCLLAREVRPRKGMLDLPRLIGRLRTRHDLATYPDHRADWARLERHTRSQLEAISQRMLGGRLSLPRLLLRQSIDDAFAEALTVPETPSVVALVGRSGDGKSVSCRQWLGAGSPGLWFDARLFDAPAGQDPAAAAEQRLSVKLPLDELLPSAPGLRPRMALDGVGRLYDDSSLATACRVARVAAENGWHVAVTCGEDEWGRVVMALQGAGLTVRPVQVGPLDDAELDAVASAEPRLASLLARPELRRVLARPKYLDVVMGGVSDASATALAESSAWAGEADVAAWCWKRVVEGAPPSAALSAAAKHIATRQADAVRDGVADDEIDAAHMASVDALLGNRVCRKVGERIVFEHDLLGDWARQRVLLGRAGEVVGFMKEGRRTASPLWLRGLRLWAADVLERQNDPAAWLNAVRAFLVTEEVAAADRVLEAAALSARAEQHLEATWGQLISDGALLRRLLARFLYAATMPNPLAMRLAPKLAAKAGDGADGLETWTAANYRVPQPAYWLPVLSVLHRHRQEAALHAPSEAAKIARLWLLHTPADAPLRKEAAELALSSARRVLRVMMGERRRTRRTHWSEGLSEWLLCHDAEHDAYAAGLTAAYVLPGEAIAFALEAAARRDPPEGVEPEEPGVEYEAPWTEGPARRVSERFREVVLGMDAFLPLATASPAAAAEVLLAVVIEPPVMTRHPGMLGLSYDDDRELSFEHIHGWAPAFYTRGPFGAFLHVAPGQAVGAIVKLVNFATDRWVERETRDLHGLRKGQTPPQPVPVPVGVDGPPIEWQGDADVYTWYLGDPRAPEPVTCALMSMERWLYDRLEAGEDVTAAIRQIVEGSRSIAFAGLLSAVARFDRELLKGPLAFLLRVPEFLYWEERPRHDFASTAMFGWQLVPALQPHVAKQVQQWYGMPHRKHDLFTIAKFLFLNDPEVRASISAIVPEWERQLKAGGVRGDRAAAVSECVKVFNLDRWEVVSLPGGGQGWKQRLTSEEQQANEAALQDANDTILAINFPHRCRELLNRPAPLDGQDLERFWADLQRVSGQLGSAENNADEDADGSGGESRARRQRWLLDGIMGGAAVLLLRHGSWLDANRPRKAWVLRQVRRVLRTPVLDDPMDRWHADETSDTRWECFFAELVVLFWSNKPASNYWRYSAAQVATGFHYSPVRRLFAAAYAQRGALAGGFDELGHLLLRWAAVRWHAECARNQWPINVNVRAEWERLINEFLSGTLAADLPTCRELAASPVEVPGLPEPPPRFRRGLDMPLIAAAFSGILRPDEAVDVAERRRWIAFWRDLIDWRLSSSGTEAGDAPEEDEGQHANDDERWPRDRLPYSSDRWLLGRLADVVLQLRPDEEAEAIWRPVLDLVPEFRHWAEDFLTRFFMHGLNADPTPASLPRVWAAMVSHAESSPRWDEADDEAWAHLLAFDHLLHSNWRERHAPLLKAIGRNLSAFVRERLRWGWRLAELVGLLRQPVAEAIRLDLLPPLADAIDARPRLLDRDQVPASVAEFLDVCLRRHELAVRNRSDVFDAMVRLLRALAAVQEPLAYQLQDRLRRG